MPNASGYITNAEVRRMRQMANAGVTCKAISIEIGCKPQTVAKHLGVATQHNRAMALRYARFVALASAYVPTFGGGR